MGETEKNNRLEDLLQVDRLQSLQEYLAGALGLAMVTVDYRGRSVTESSGCTDFCKCMRKHEKYGSLCSQCYAHAGLHATIAGEPYLYRCHGGLTGFAVPLMDRGEYVGAVMGGQCELAGQHPVLEPILPQSTSWEAVPELARLRSGVHKITVEKLEAAARLVQEIVRNLMEAHSYAAGEEVGRISRELMEEKATRVNLEMALLEEDSGKVMERLDSEHLFYVLNLISRLAFLEKAEETERTACDFAAMMRYVLENGEYNCVTLGEELEYIDYYLQIQRRRMEGRLRYEVRVPEKYHGTLCPFMLMHPLVKNTVKYVLDNSKEGGALVIQSREEGALLVLTIGCDCVTDRQNHQVPDLEGKRQGSALTRIDQSLKRVFGRACGVTSRRREDGLNGMEIEVRLPLNGGIVER